MSLGFNFATLTNYNTGPDNGTPTKVDPASATNGFIAGTVIAPQHVNFLINLIADQLADAVDGIGGGTYTLGSALRFQGADVEINAGLEILAAGELNVQSGGEINILSTGVMNVETGGSVLVEGAIIAGGGGAINITTGGVLESATSAQITIGDDANFFRLTLTPQSIQPDGSGFPAWTPRFSGDLHAGMVAGWQQEDIASPYTIAFALPLNVGDDVTEINVVLFGSSTSGTGGHASLPVGSDLPSIALVRVGTTGTTTVVARKADDAANVAAYNVNHTVTLANGSLDSGTLPHTVLSSDAYYIVIRGETGANAVAGELAVMSVSGDVVARTYRSALMTY
jgi:hypothetical protein